MNIVNRFRYKAKYYHHNKFMNNKYIEIIGLI